MKLFHSLFATVLAASSILSFAQDAVPKHLELARAIVANVKPENNHYSHDLSQQYIRLPSDVFSSKYQVNANCLGFVQEVLHRGSNLQFNPSTRKYKKAYSITDFVEAVDRGEFWQKLPHVQDLKPGDVLLWSFLNKRSDQWANGHIVLVNAAPVKLDRVLDRGKGQYQRWEVQTIDSSSGPSSSEDTRFVEGTTVEQAEESLKDKTSTLKLNGAGSGKFYLFTDGQGAIQGVSYGFPKAKLNYQDKDWRVLLARISDAK